MMGKTIKNATLLMKVAILTFGCHSQHDGEPVTQRLPGGGEDADTIYSCGAAALAWAQEVDAFLDGNRTCGTDDECVLLRPELDCRPEYPVYLGFSHIAVAADAADAYDLLLAVGSSHFCPRTESCATSSDSTSGEQAECLDGMCTVTSTSVETSPSVTCGPSAEGPEVCDVEEETVPASEDEPDRLAR